MPKGIYDHSKNKGNTGKKWKIKDTSAMHHSAWNKGKKYPQITGENNYQWKGRDCGYVSMHTWVRRWKGKPSYCEMCGNTTKKACEYDWANIDHQYRRILNDYIRLCHSCHKKYDVEHNSSKDKK